MQRIEVLVTNIQFKLFKVFNNLWHVSETAKGLNIWEHTCVTNVSQEGLFEYLFVKPLFLSAHNKNHSLFYAGSLDMKIKQGKSVMRSFSKIPL